MTVDTWPPVADVVPHAPPMVLLSRIVSHDEARTVCAIDVTPSSRFLDSANGVPAWVGIEYMGQCVAVHAGLVGRARGEPVRLGLLIGARRIDFRVCAFAAGRSVLVSATHVWGEHELASFECTLADEFTAELLAEATLSVFSPRDGLDRWMVR